MDVAFGWHELLFGPYTVEKFRTPPFLPPGTAYYDPQQVSPRERLHCHPTFIKESVEAWQRAGIGTFNTEAGFDIRGSVEYPTFVPARHTNEVHQLTWRAKDLSPVTFAIFHTHSNTAAQHPTVPQDLSVKNPYTNEPLTSYVGARSGLFVSDRSSKDGYRRIREGLDWLKPCP
jgi:hypothetical protein